MADNIFSRSYQSASKPTDAKTTIEGISARTRVPVNVLMAFGEAAGAQTPEDMVRIATEAGDFIGVDLAAGKSIEDVIRAAAGGDEALTGQILGRAKQLRAELYPDAAPAQPEGGAPTDANALRDLSAGFGGAMVTGAGNAIDYLGNAADRGLDMLVGAPARAVTGRTDQVKVFSPATDLVGGAVRAGGEYLQGFVSEEARQAAQKAMPKGDLLDPSSWKAPEDLTVRGVLQVASEGLGSLAPVVLAALVSKNPGAISAVTGGAMAGGDGRETAAQIVDSMWQAKDANGVSELEKDSDLFRTMVAEGAKPEEAYAQLRERAMNASGDLQAIVGGLGGAVTGRLVSKGLPAALAGTSLTGNVARGIVVGALEEGSQEALETTVARQGVNIGAGTSINPTEGTVEAATMGALVGGPVGVFAGINTAREAQQAAAAPKPAGGPLRQAMNEAAPKPVAPTGGMPTVTHSTVVEDGRYGGRNQRTIARLSNGDTLEINGTLDDPQVNAAFEAELQARYGQQTPPPAPMREAADNGPAPLFNGLQAGAPVTVTVQGGNSFQAVFDGETAMDITVIDEDGAYREIPRAEIEAGRVTIGAGLNPVIEEGTSPKAPPAPLVQEITPPTARPDMSAPAAEALDFFEERAALIQADGATREEANARAAELTLDYIARMGVNNDADLNELASAFASQIGDGAPAAQPAPAVAPDRIMGKNNMPFPTEKRAQDALGKLGDQAAQYRIEAVENGFALVKRSGGQPQASSLPGKVTEIGSEGATLVHGGRAGLSLDSVQIVRSPSEMKQGKSGRSYGGFYAAAESDAAYAESYAAKQPDGQTYDVRIKPGTKVLEKTGDVTRLSAADIDAWKAQGIGVVVGKDPRGKTEYAVIDKNAIESLNPRGGSQANMVTEVRREQYEGGKTAVEYRLGADATASVLISPDGTAHLMNIQIGDANSTARGKGRGTQAYAEIGQKLAAEGIRLQSTQWSKHNTAISPAALRVWEKLAENGQARRIGTERGKVVDRFTGKEEVRDVPIYEFTGKSQEAAGVRPDGMAGIGQAGTVAGDQPAGGQRNPGNALEGQGTGGVAGTGTEQGVAGATGVTEQGNPLTSEPAGVADVAGVAQDDDAASWDAMNQDERADAVKRVGYVTKKGNVDRPGLKLASSPWASLPDAAKDKLRGVLRAPAPAQAERAQIEGAQAPAPQEEVAPQPEAQTQPEAPAPQAETQAEAPAAPEAAPEPMPEQPAAPQAEETDPLRAAIRAGMAAGVVEHTTKKGKTLRGYIIPLGGGFKGKEIEAVDEYSFRKDGGMFVRAEKAEAFMGEATPQTPAPQADTPDAPPVTDDRKEARLRQARNLGRQAALDNEPRTAPDWMEGEIADAWLEGYGAGIAERAQVSETEGPFGPILTGYEGDWKGAALELERRQTGEAPGALSHPDVGPIALVWGKAGTSNSDGMGLAKLIAWHPEVLDDLQGRLSDAKVVDRTAGRIQLRSDKDNFGIRLQYDGQNKTWLLTAFERGRQRTERSSSRLSEIWAGSFSPAPLAQDTDTANHEQNQPAPQTEAQPENAPATETEGQTDTTKGPRGPKLQDFGQKEADAAMDDAAAAMDAKEAEPDLGAMFDDILDELTGGDKGQGAQAPAPDQPAAPETDRIVLGRAIAEALRSGTVDLSTIVKARKFAQIRMGKEMPDKEIEEAFEAGLVLRAREIAADPDLAGEEAFSALVTLYNNQPNLITRTSTSVEQQAYSTPAPLAYLATYLARITPKLNGRIYEPTAGNGMLLMTADPANVVLNELNPDRFAVVSAIYRGATMNQGDAMAYDPQGEFDRIITNPPFGKVKNEQGVTQRFDLGGSKTTEIDHAIVWKSLAKLKSNGRAVLIIGGHQGDIEARRKGYRADNAFRFMTKLYDAFNVTEHFTVDGALYRRQGAGWPVDVIVIEGTGKSELPYPYVDVPPLYSEWTDLGERLNYGAGSLDTRGKRVGGRDGDLGQAPDGTPDAGTLGGGAGRPDQQSGGQGQRAGTGSGTGSGVPDGANRPADPTGDSPSGMEFGASQQGGGLQPDVAGGAGGDQAATGNAGNADGGDASGLSGSDLRVGPRSPSEAAQSAAQNIGESFADFAKGLNAIFDIDPNRLNSGLPVSDEAYQKAKPFFIAAVRKLGLAGKDIADVMRGVIRQLLDAGLTKRAVQNMKGAVTRFVSEVQKGIIPRAELEAQPEPKAPQAAPKKQRENTEAETNYQVQYQPHSTAEFAVGTLVPRNMQQAMDSALNALAERVGDLDAFVADRLGMTREEVTGTPTKAGKFSAEQVDALALAIDNIENGGGFIIGDQTGVGKGRVVAGILRYAMKQGRVPVFVTKQPGLFGDMVRDLRDIGVSGIEKRILPSKVLRGADAVPLSNTPGDVLESPSDNKLKNAFAEMRKTGRLPDGYDMLFTTYSQLQYKAGSVGVKTFRQEGLDAVAANSIIVLDESHEAGGTETRKFDKDTGEMVPTRADYFREVIQSASGVMYSSATYAKNPTVMSLYSRTDIRMAVDDMDKLADAIRAGGVPLQQVMANMLVKSGQYVRRERSFEGVSMNLRVLDTDQAVAATGSKLVATVFNLDRDYMALLRGGFMSKLAEQGLIDVKDISVGEEGADTMGFANIMHNLVNQMFFGLKAEAVVAQAIELHRQGVKPLIAVSNTNESILRDYVQALDLKAGDPVDMPFNEIFRRYLARLRRVTVKDSNGNKRHFSMTDADILDLGGREVLNAIKAVEKQIEDADLSGVPAMPLDYVLDRMEEAGMKVGEITGRGLTSRGGKVTPRESSDAIKKRTMNDFNSGKIDAVVLNQSGSTGFSLHARNAKDNDGKKRHMIVLQPDPNIDVFMQMLGRVHRTGQSQLPDYTIAVSDLALEKRVAANLMRKMASLNANTTAAKDSAISLDNVTDFMNRYGDQVIADMLREDEDLASRLNIRVSATGAPAEGLAQKVTGRMAVLSPREVADLYDRIETAYREYVDALDRMGLNMLEAKTLDLQARVLDSAELTSARDGGDSPFAEAAYIERMSVRRLGRSFTSAQVQAEVAKELDGKTGREYAAEIGKMLDGMLPDYQDKLRVGLDEANQRLAEAATDAQKERAAASVAAWEKKILDAEATVEAIKREVETLRPGALVYLTLREDGQDLQFYAVPLAINTKGVKGNPTAASTIKIRFAIADAAREVVVPLSKLMSQDSPFSYTVMQNVNAVANAFDAGQSESREERQIITGNILSGYSQFTRGQIVMFTREDGSIGQGVLMPRAFDAQAEMDARSVKFATVDQVIRFLSEGRNRLVKTEDGVVGISKNWNSYSLMVRRQGGKPYYLNQAVRRIVGDFESGRGDKAKNFTKTVDSEADVRAALQAWIDNVGAEYVTDSHKDEAREITGQRRFGENAEMRGSVAATLTGTELGAYSDMRDLGRKAEAWYRANLVGTTVTNAATGMVIRFDDVGANKIGGRKGDILYRSVPALREILSQGVLVASEPDNRGRPDIRAVHKIRATVSLAGQTHDLIATVREKQDGTFHYDLSRATDGGAKQLRDSASEASASVRGGDGSPRVRSTALEGDPKGGGTKALRSNSPANPTVGPDGPTSALEGDPADLNLEIAPVENKPRMSAERMRAVAERLNAELARTGIDRTVRARLVRGLMDEAGVEIQGRQRGNVLEVNPNAPAGALGVLRHEIVHVLRDAGLWGQPYGLFEQGEWRGLVAEARKRDDIRARVLRDYKGRNLTEAQITEEIIAEMYREWAQRRDAAGGLDRVFGKIRGFLRALANALRGQGFQSAGQTFERIANGTVGGRGPDGGGGGGRSAEMRRALNAVVPKRIASTFEEARAAVASFQGKPLVNEATGLVATVSRNTLDKMMSRSAVAKSTSAQLHALAVANADALFKQAKLGWTKRDRGGDTGIAGIHRFFAVTEKPDGRMAMVKMTVKETVREVDRNPLYTIEAVDEVDAPSAAMWVASAIDADAIDPKAIRSAEDVVNMARMVDDFNRQPRSPELRMPTMPFARNEAEYDKAERGLISNLLTDAMAGQFGKLGSERMSLLGLVPGRALFAELGKYLPGAQTYLRLKEEMDALRSEWHHITDEVATRWRKALSKDGAGNKAMMDLMHDATRAGVDPSLRFVPPQKKKGELQEDHRARVAKLEEAYADLRPRWNALPDDFKAIYREVRDTYGKLSDAFEKTLIENVKTAMTINVRRAERAYEAEVERIAGEGLTGQEKDDALEAAKKKLVTAKAKAEWGINARVTKLRLQFETNKVDGPYFPLMRHGTFFVTVRDADGKVVSFSRFENVKKQMSFVKEMQQDPALTVKFGTMEASDMRDQVDPNFVAEVERILGENVSDPKVMDMVWQRWLETLPDFSVRRSRIHRKGTPGFDGDAFRAFGKQVFHGGHQLARLKYSMLMDDALRQARKEAEGSSDPNRNGLIVDEMARRHEFVMDPKGGPIAQFLTSAAFVYYLGITPAAALVNLSQTTVVGIPMLAAGFRQANVGRAARELTRALADFVQGRADATKSPRLSADEKAAMEEAYRRGTIDKSEAHDLAGVAESGVEYSNRRMQVMKPISFLFHHTERMNREITYLAAYRMARSYGMDHADAIQKASDLTWKTHFDYANTSRPRLVQNDFAKVMLVFRNFQLNMLWRLFRDAHQIFKGRSPEERREARTQLLGITAMMFAHAGITGTWTYALLMTLAGLFMGGDSDDAEEELKRAIVETFGPGAGGILLKGIPGQITGVDLTSRMGMPELWFRTSDRQLEGDDEYYYFMEQMVGAVPAIGQNVWRGMQQIGEGNVWRGVETAMPKAIRDLMKGYRYATDGVETYNGDPIIEEISAGDALIQAMGFTPAQVAERYEQNTRAKNFERRIERERSAILKDATTGIREGAGIPQAVLEEIREFNAEHPTDAITSDTILRSLKSRIRASQEMEGGIRLNPRLDASIRARLAPSINQ